MELTHARPMVILQYHLFLIPPLHHVNSVPQYYLDHTWNLGSVAELCNSIPARVALYLHSDSDNIPDVIYDDVATLIDLFHCYHHFLFQQQL
jgi:hypothetical protein